MVLFPTKAVRSYHHKDIYCFGLPPSLTVITVTGLGTVSMPCANKGRSKFKTLTVTGVCLFRTYLRFYQSAPASATSNYTYWCVLIVLIARSNFKPTHLSPISKCPFCCIPRRYALQLQLWVLFSGCSFTITMLFIIIMLPVLVRLCRFMLQGPNCIHPVLW